MKIFISHSSKDKWAARRISQDLIENGAETFLDEKDIKTGESIDTTIKHNLKDCSDFLILLSPASIKSDWVLIELGGAIALEKKIIPILLYVGANEIPQIINLRLARDINAVDKYYEEVENRIKGISTKKVKEKKKLPSARSFKSGDFVKVVSQKPNDIMREDWLIDWEEPMNDYLGQIVKIARPSRNATDAYVLEGDNYEYIFAKEWLFPINK